MTSNGHTSSSGHRSARTGVALLLLSGAALALIVPSACGGDDNTNPGYIGVTDATPPRLGERDASATR